MYVFVIRILVALCLAKPVLAYDGNRTMEEADIYLRNGQYLEAIGAYRHVSEYSECYEAKARALLRIGDIYAYFLNNFEVALRHYALVTKHYGASGSAAQAHFNSGMILYEANRYHEALEHFRTYLKKYPSGDRRDTAQFMVEMCLRPPPPRVREEEPSGKFFFDDEIKILLISNVYRAVITANTAIEVRAKDERTPLCVSSEIILERESRTVKINGRKISHPEVMIITRGSPLTVNGKSYRGKLRVTLSSGGGLDFVNVLPVEKYLYGVVPLEMPSQWPSEALKAQAIASRSYALYQKVKNRDREYDVRATTSSQVYGGIAVENERTNRAVDETKGIVAYHNGHLILSYFHANSGGMTEDAKNVWNADVPYLRSVRDEYSEKAPNTSWQCVMSFEEIRENLRKNGIVIGQIESIVPLDVTPSGRTSKIMISHEGRQLVMSGNEFRMKMGPTLLRSTLFTMHRDGQTIRFEGKGYGHGVGMSQWGAYMMAREGKTFEEILRHYYPEVELRSLLSISPSLPSTEKEPRNKGGDTVSSSLAELPVGHLPCLLFSKKNRRPS